MAIPNPRGQGQGNGEGRARGPGAALLRVMEGARGSSQGGGDGAELALSCSRPPRASARPPRSAGRICLRDIPGQLNGADSGRGGCRAVARAESAGLAVGRLYSGRRARGRPGSHRATATGPAEAAAGIMRRAPQAQRRPRAWGPASVPAAGHQAEQGQSPRAEGAARARPRPPPHPLTGRPRPGPPPAGTRRAASAGPQRASAASWPGLCSAPCPPCRAWAGPVAAARRGHPGPGSAPDGSPPFPPPAPRPGPLLTGTLLRARRGAER